MNKTPSRELIFSLLPHRVTQMLLFVVFPLIWVGGLVTTYDAGMAVPDWPNTYNYNMFAYPVRDWFFGPWDLFVEHGHRLLGSLAGILAIILLSVTIWKEPRGWLRWAAFLVLLLVIAQGLLGGMRVVMDERILAQVHGTVGPTFFAIVAAVAVLNGRWWIDIRQQNEPRPENYGWWMKRLAQIICLLSFLQLALGATIRHTSEMATPDFFTIFVASHIMVATLLAIFALVLLVFSRLRIGKNCGVRGLSFFVGFLVLIQVGLGLATWIVKFGWPAWLDHFSFAAHFTVAEKSFFQMNMITAHVAIGSLILATSAALTIRCMRVFERPV
jgi:cytochrome c oxidase assembly protein subunit 15